VTAVPGPRANDCLERFHIHVDICQRAGYTNGRTDVLDAVRQLIADVDARYAAVQGTGSEAIVAGYPRLIDVEELRALLDREDQS
jgi:hypothetical protein